MSSPCIEEITLFDGPWYRIAEEILSPADISINGKRPWDVQVKNPEFFKRVLQEGSLGLGESYMDGWWDCQRLDMFFYNVIKYRVQDKMPNNVWEILRIAISRITNLQSIKRAWIVGKVHYDLGNELFSRMLDPYMQYSCAYWKDATTLDQAQENKLRLICEKLQLAPGMSLLDIGCGWGGLAEYAAKNYGVSVIGVTISEEQQHLAQQRCKGLDVTILLQDYRDLHEQVDRVVSVGMFEHVGTKNYETYFNIVSNNLKPDGLFLLHTIGANTTNDEFDAWISKYIFPNGKLPSIKQIAAASEPHFVMEDWHNFGADYELTLMAWYQRFLTAWPEIAHNFSPRFKRMFIYYLNVNIGAFRARSIQLWQVLFSRGREASGFPADILRQTFTAIAQLII